MTLRIGLAADHAGYELKQQIASMLKGQGVSVKDYGTTEGSQKSVDYPDFGHALGEGITSGEVDRGVAICGSGIGISISVNRFPKVRGTLAHDKFTAEMGRLHNDSNVLCLGSRVVDTETAKSLVKIWLDTPFEGGRHQRRVDKLGGK